MEHVDPEIQITKLESGEWLCKVCSYTNARIARIKSHFITSHGEDGTGDLQCPVCKAQFNFNVSFTEHLKDKHKIIGKLEYLNDFGDGNVAKDEKGVIICLKCGYLNPRMPRFKVHFAKEHGFEATKMLPQLPLTGGQLNDNNQSIAANFVKFEPNNQSSQGQEEHSTLQYSNTELPNSTNNTCKTEVGSSEMTPVEAANKDGHYVYNCQNVLDTYRAFRIKGLSFDVILCCKSSPNNPTLGYIPCHRILLSLSSPFFEAMLKRSPTKVKSIPYVYIPEICEQDMIYILDLIYNTKVLVSIEHKNAFLYAIDKLQIKGVREENHVNNDIKKTIPTPIKSEVGVHAKEAGGLLENQGFGTLPCLKFGDQVMSELQFPLPSPLKQEKTPVMDVDKNNNIFNFLDPQSSSTFQNGKNAYSIHQGSFLEVAQKKLKKVQASTIAKKPKLEKSKGVDSKPENTEASNAVYREWKGKFSSADNEGFHCHQCSEKKTFSADSSLRRHYKQLHERPCKCCKLPFYHEAELNQHVVDYHEFKCPICGKSFTAKSSLKRHHDKDHKETVV